MTNVQLYLSIGVPLVSNLLGIIGLMFYINAKFDAVTEKFKSVDAKFDTVYTKVDALRVEMTARFETAQERLLRVEGVLDARLKHIEERAR